MCACTCSLSSHHMRTWGQVAIHRLGRGLSRSWPCGPCCGPSSLQNSEKIKLCFSYPADGVSIWQPPDNKYSPQLRPKWLSSCSLTQLEDTAATPHRALLQCHSLDHELHTRLCELLTRTTSVHPHNRCESRSDVPHINNGETDGRRQKCGL